MHGQISEDKLIKRGKQVVKYRRYNGYAVAESDLEKVHGVELHTKEDNIIYAPRHLFYQEGIINDFNGEKQYILPLHHWERVREV